MSQLIEALDKISDREAIEQYVSTLSVEDATELFFFVGEAPEKYKDKIPSLIKGVSLFGLIAMIATEERVIEKLFKNYLKEEFFQHQLFLALDEFQKAILSLDTESSAFLKQAIQNPDTSFHELESTIRTILQHCKSMAETENRFLKFIWQTERPDLIERGSRLKEELIRAKEQLERLPSLFVEAKNAQFTSPDDASAIEALVDLGISYPDQISEFAKELGAKADEKNPAEFIQEKLQKAGLRSIKSLKEKKLYSKALLRHYLNDKR